MFANAPSGFFLSLLFSVTLARSYFHCARRHKENATLWGKVAAILSEKRALRTQRNVSAAQYQTGTSKVWSIDDPQICENMYANIEIWNPYPRLPLFCSVVPITCDPNILMNIFFDRAHSFQQDWLQWSQFLLGTFADEMCAGSF